MKTLAAHLADGKLPSFLTQYSPTNVPAKLDSELTIQYFDDINVLEQSVPSDVNHVGSKECHIIDLINRYCLCISCDHHQH